MVTIGNKEYFKGIGEIKFEGKGSKNPLSFKYYNIQRTLAFKKVRGMKCVICICCTILDTRRPNTFQTVLFHT